MDIYIASNNGEIGGGEVMLLHLARAARSLGHKITIIGPAQPAELIEAAQDEGFSTVTISVANRKAYMLGLRAWRARNKQKLLWCNGLVPALATAGDKNRIVHLHQLPTGLQRQAFTLARQGAMKVLVPSHLVASRIKKSLVFENWGTEVPQKWNLRLEGETVRLGFLGRPSLIKGTHTLAQAIKSLNENDNKCHFELVVGGESKFIDEKSADQIDKSFAELGDDVTLLGWVTPEELFSQIDILVVPSEIEESFGLVAIEAMSAHQPLIISDAGALPEVVGNTYPWIFPQGNIAELATKVMDLTHQIRTDKKNTDEQLAASYWRWHENYSPEAGKERLRILLETLERN